MRIIIFSVIASIMMVSAVTMVIPVPVMAAVNSGDSNKTDVWRAMRQGGLTDIGKNIYGGEEGTDFRLLTFRLIRRFLEVLGVVFLVLTVYAGFKWMTAGGNSEQIDEAKALLRNAVIGLA
ncbi:MAG: hypothetical protein AAB817_01535, partial [Patescibacteria group bacterium]